MRNLEEARSIDDADPRIASLQDAIQSLLDEVNRVIEIDRLDTLLRFEGVVTQPLTPEALVFGGNRLWVMDGGLGRVLAVNPGGVGGPIETYRAGRRYGTVEGGVPAAIAWDAANDRLLVIDRERSLFAVSLDADPVPLPLRDAGELATVDAIAAYAGNLYLLDAGGGEVWRYLPAGGGYDSERSGLLGAVSLRGAAALHVDGDVFVLTGDAVRRFTGSREGVAQLQGIDRPLNAPAGLAADAGTIHIADRGGQRIVVGDRDGPFLRQYTHPGFTDLRGVALAPDGGAVYILTSLAIVTFAPTE